MSNREKIVLAIVAAITVCACYGISQLTTSDGASGSGTGLADVVKELVDNVAFLALCALLILALAFLPVGL